MPKGPKGQKRPADVIGNAVTVMKIATGEIEESGTTDDGKSKAAVELGRKGGKARAAVLSKAKRRNIAKAAARARWEKKKWSAGFERDLVGVKISPVGCSDRPGTLDHALVTNEDAKSSLPVRGCVDPTWGRKRERPTVRSSSKGTTLTDGRVVTGASRESVRLGLVGKRG